MTGLLDVINSLGIKFMLFLKIYRGKSVSIVSVNTSLLPTSCSTLRTPEARFAPPPLYLLRRWLEVRRTPKVESRAAQPSCGGRVVPEPRAAARAPAGIGPLAKPAAASSSACHRAVNSSTH